VKACFLLIIAPFVGYMLGMNLGFNAELGLLVFALSIGRCALSLSSELSLFSKLAVPCAALLFIGMLAADVYVFAYYPQLRPHLVIPNLFVPPGVREEKRDEDL